MLAQKVNFYEYKYEEILMCSSIHPINGALKKCAHVEEEFLLGFEDGFEDVFWVFEGILDDIHLKVFHKGF